MYDLPGNDAERLVQRRAALARPLQLKLGVIPWCYYESQDTSLPSLHCLLLSQELVHPLTEYHVSLVLFPGRRSRSSATIYSPPGGTLVTMTMPSVVI